MPFAFGSYPAGQVAHVDASTATFPLSHATHSVDPGFAATTPTPHASHAVAPRADACVPAAHASHVAAPAAAENVPASHGSHRSRPRSEPKRPAAHSHATPAYATCALGNGHSNPAAFAAADVKFTTCAAPFGSVAAAERSDAGSEGTVPSNALSLRNNFTSSE